MHSTLFRSIQVLCIFFIALSSPIVHADPDWDSTDMKFSDCDDVFWKEAGMCYGSYYRQREARLESYIKHQIKALNYSNEPHELCDKEALSTGFDEVKKAWYAYTTVNCTLSTYCNHDCGSGYSASTQECSTSAVQKRVEYLENIVKDGISGYCDFPNPKTQTLDTTHYLVQLSAQCELGLFECDKITYKGTNKKTGASIILNGKIYLKEEQGIDMPKGFEFVSSKTVYKVTNDGLLQVFNQESGKVLLNEKGTWVKNP